MLLKRATLEGIVDGSVRAVFRRWKTPRVRAGTSLRTAVGVVSVTSIEPTTLDAITERAARQAGYLSRAALLEELDRHGGGRLYRIGVRFDGADPRIELRTKARLSATERDEIESRLARLGARSADGPWGLPVLRLIAKCPGVRAAELAKKMGMETRPFKARVRQLKELGLTESLEIGYRLSPRGRAVLRGSRR